MITLYEKLKGIKDSAIELINTSVTGRKVVKSIDVFGDMALVKLHENGIELSKKDVYAINGVVVSLCILLIFIKMYLGFNSMVGTKFIVSGIYSIILGSLKIFDYIMINTGVL